MRRFKVVNQIKAKVNRIYGRPVKSCTNILALTARDFVVVVGGPTWNVGLGRRESIIASRALAEMPSHQH
ncbi:hypothetical protein Golax_012892 [Gossypium laxum]|uniref:peroxidase n=1 Tax=Gossypium laxum TaxID=34288 RepID=A0A7J8ZQE5_9ROSI|nr:hypothetical protein [Gossypium laxum]